ncbi:MAG: electron transfer flavoprotein subunit alpha/FixB family protein [candidate division KSB1 bacterium]|nr:electron transfer flavoprotein subunit alpha/FixB family protein [candidate division KSB1 bacterium]
MAGSVCVVTEQFDGSFRRVSYELLTAARRLAEAASAEVIAIVGPKTVAEAGATLGAYGANKVVQFAGAPESEDLSQLCESLVPVLQELQPMCVLVPGTVHGQELAGRLAARVGAAAVSAVLDVSYADGALTVLRPLYGGKVLATVAVRGTPAIVTVRPNTFGAVAGGSGPAEGVTFAWVPPARAPERLHFRKSAAGRPELTEADIIVSGGRGVGSAENFRVLEELADVLGAAVGASRAAVDAGWRPQADQVGQTGKVVSPKLYIACGISGSVQHWAGISSAKCIVGINKDPQAPIFSRADYGIVGDLFEIVPELTRQVKALKGQG